MHLTAAALSDPGRGRKVNEDRAWAQVFDASEGVPVGLFAVCDGMGGHLAGECASQWALESIKRSLADYFCARDPRATVRLSPEEIDALAGGASATRRLEETQAEKRVREAVEEANRVVFQYARHKPEEAGDAGTEQVIGSAVVRRRRGRSIV